MKHWLRRLVRGLAVLGASLVILLALLVGLFRLLVPQVPEYQAELEAWATEALGVPVRVGRLDARLALRGPELTLLDATVGGQGSGMLPLVAREVSVVVSVPRLVTERQVAVSRVRLAGVVVELARGADGQWLLQGQPLELDDRDAPAELPELPDFRLDFLDGELRLQPGPEAPVQVLGDIQLAVTRDGGRVSLDLRATPPEALGTRIEVSAEASPGEGRLDLDRLERMPWRAFIDLRDTDLAAWRAWLPGDWALPAAGRGGLRLWVAALGRQPLEASAELDLLGLAPPPGTLPSPLEQAYDRLAGRFEWRRHETGWTAAAGRLLVERGGLRWPETELRLEVEGDLGGRARVAFEGGFLRLEDLLPALAWVPAGDWRERLLAMAPAGEVETLELSLDLVPDAEPGYSASGRVRALQLAAIEDWPGVSGLGGGFRADETGGRFQVAGEGFAFERRPSFDGLVSLGRVEGLVVWRRSPAGWRVVGDDLRVSGVDLTARGDFELLFDEEGAEIDIRAEVIRAELGPAAARFLPVGHMPPPAVRWLRRGFPQGELTRGRFELSGRPRDFPFEDGSGHFLASGEVSGVTLDYADGWPLVTDVSGRVRFERETLTGEVSGGVISASPLLRGEMAIDNLRRPTLTVTGEVDSSVDRLLAFLRQSPVAEALGEPVFAARGSGAARTQVDLTLPLFDIQQHRWQGEIALDNARVGYGDLPAEIVGLRGRLLLDTGEVRSDDLVGSLFGEVFTAELSPASDDGYHTVLRARGRLGPRGLNTLVGEPLAARTRGVAEWSLSGWFPEGQPDGTRAPLRFALDSLLTGLEVDLPVPAGKPAGEPLPLQLVATLDPATGLSLSGELGREARWLLELVDSPAGWQLAQGNLRLGGGTPLLPLHEGLAIDGTIGELQVDAWLALAATLARESGSAVLQRVDLIAETAYGLGQEVPELTLLLERGLEEWRLRLDSEAVAGDVQVPFDLTGDTALVMDMQRLHIAGQGPLAEPVVDEALPRRAEPDPRTLPAMRIRVEEFVLAGMAFGALEAQLDRASGGLVASRLQSRSPSFQVNADGRWLADDSGSRTELAFVFESTDIAGALQAMRFEPFMSANAGTVDARLHWEGGPASESWRDSLGGSIALRVQNGRLSEVEPGAGRVVGLMSLSALPRRLALDFRDVFGKGLGFDRIEGDFLLIDGDAYTDNLRLRGPTADIALLGRTGLARRDYAQQALVTADVGMALPAVGGLLAGPGVAAAILVFQELFRQPMRGIGQAAYCVSGPWEAPQVQRLTQTMIEEGYGCVELPGDWDQARARGD